MEHPFKDKVFVFIGTPNRCTRRAASDALIVVGGIPDDKITWITEYVVAFNGAEKTKAYQKAIRYDRDSSMLTLLNEEQFFDILEGRAAPPEKLESKDNVTIIPGNDPEGEARELERIKQDVLNHKRMNNLAKHGIPTPDGRVKIDLRPLVTAKRVLDIIRANND